MVISLRVIDGTGQNWSDTVCQLTTYVLSLMKIGILYFCVDLVQND